MAMLLNVTGGADAPPPPQPAKVNMTQMTRLKTDLLARKPG
ncbi:hypothetical protein GALL_82850 [mine drainage metagenome]|uniref:Uncharacterized protein n=1 Tax=mine drainage metagenome TaxID=410659 RepID=A0A1J5SLW8_9ZZZZ